MPTNLSIFGYQAAVLLKTVRKILARDLYKVQFAPTWLAVNQTSATTTTPLQWLVLGRRFLQRLTSFFTAIKLQLLSFLLFFTCPCEKIVSGAFFKVILFHKTVLLYQYSV